MARKKQKKQQSQQKNNTIAKALIALGILLILLGAATHTEIYYRYQITQKERPIVHISGNIPHEIIIPTAKIDINVDQGGIVNGEWVLSNTVALYLPTSGFLGEGYNTIIYAHNTTKLFGKLRQAKVGDLINMKDQHGTVYDYQIISKEDVDPGDLKKLYSQDKNIVTLFTCDGWADKSRLLIKARLIKH